ncbi:MAG: hypothetical protein JNK17_11920 [Hydrogenophaga sp.]|nr:hypothetical protein [Hydrogenophaga sp.]
MKEETPLWKVVVGVAGGVLLAGAIGWALRLWLVAQAVKEITESANQAAQQILESSQRQMQVIQQREADRQEAVAKVRQEERLRIAMEQRLKAQQQMVQYALEAAKEEAWKRYYKRPVHCGDAVGEAFVECGNHHIRAKRKFEELYAAGKL